MLNISVNVTPEQLSNSTAVQKLATALSELQTPLAPSANLAPQPVQAPAANAPLNSPAQAVPVAPQAQAVEPSVAPAQPAAAVPTTQAAFSAQQLAIAAMQLKDLGRIQDMQNLLSQFGVVAITQLSESQLPAFAQGLQALGVKL